MNHVEAIETCFNPQAQTCAQSSQYHCNQEVSSLNFAEMDGWRSVEPSQKLLKRPPKVETNYRRKFGGLSGTGLPLLLKCFLLFNIVQVQVRHAEIARCPLEIAG